MLKRPKIPLNMIEIFTSKICGSCRGLFESQLFKNVVHQQFQ